MAEQVDLREMPVQEFEAFVKGLQSGQQIESIAQISPSPVEGQEPPSSQVDRTQDVLMQENVRGGVRPGVFLNTKRGVDAATRYTLGLDENQLNQFKLLTQLYGPGNVDLSEEGKFVIRNQPSKTGGVEDIMVDPVGFESGDVAEIASQITPMAIGALAAFRGGKLPKGNIAKALAAIAGGAVGTELTGGVQDSFVRWLADNEVNATEIASKRAKMAVADAALGLVAAGGTKVITKAAEAIAGLPPIFAEVGTTQTREAAKALQKKTGVEYKLSPGEASERESLMRVEAIGRRRLGTAGPLERQLVDAESAENELRRVFLDLPRTMPDDELMTALPKPEKFGSEALGELRKKSSKLEGAVASAREDILATGTKEAQELAGVNLASPMNATEVGRTARGKVVSDFQTFRGEMGQRYDDFLSRPEVRARTVKGNDLANAAAQIEEEFVPKAAKSKKSTLVGPRGESLPSTTGNVESLESFVPTKFRGFVEELKGLKGAEVSINDLKRIRTAIDNSIAEGISIPGTDVAQLRGLRSAVDKNITESLKGIDPKLLGEWQSLSSDYAKGSARFDRVGIREMLVTEGERGSIGDATIAESVIGDSPKALDKYNTYKEFFGSGSKEFQDLQQLAREKTLFGSLGEIDDFVDGNVLRARLRNLRPEIAKELFGVEEKELHRIGEVLSRAKGKLDSEELRKLATSKSLTATKLEALEKAENELAVAYNNKLIKAASKGAINAERINPGEFVRFAMDMDSTEAGKVISALSDSPELLKQMRQLAIEDVWDKIAVRVGERKLVSAKALEGVLGKNTDTFKKIVGEDTFEGLNLLLKVVSPREGVASKFSGAAGLSGAMDLQNLFLSGEVGSLRHIANRWLVSFFYSGPLRKMVTNLATPSDRSRLINGVVASTPFLEATLEKFGSDGALMIMHELKNVVEPLQRKDLFIQGEIKDFDPSQLSKDEFKEWLSNTMGAVQPTP